MVLTFWCILAVLGSLLAVGIPVCWLLGGRKPLAAGAFIRAPFLGMAVIVLVLQNLVMLDVPIKWAAPFFWLALVSLWLWFLISGHVRASFKVFPFSLFGASLLIYLVQGLGLLHDGVHLYVGRAHTDQFNYTSLAQFIMEEPFSTSHATMGQRPFMIPAILIKDDRIGQSVLHGFFAISSLQDAKSLFEPTILLSPALLVLGVYALVRRLGLGHWQALASGMGAGLLPGLSQLHLECFLSHALSVPLVIFWFVLLADLAEQPDWRTFLAAALFVSATASIYTEIWPLLCCAIVLILGVASWKNIQATRLWIWAGCLMAAPFVLLLGFVHTFLQITDRLNWKIFSEIYPWALQVEGLSRIWLGDLAVSGANTLQALVRPVTLALTGLAYWGLMHFCVGQWRKGQRPGENIQSSVVGALSLCLLVMGSVPILVFLKDDQHPYQFYKLLLSMSPLLVVGLALACHSIACRRVEELPARSIAGPSRCRTAIAFVLMATILLMGLAGTTNLGLKTLRLQPQLRALCNLFHVPDRQELSRRLETLHDSNLLLASTDTVANNLLNAWACYFARHNRVWVANPQINDIEPKRVPEAAPTLFPANWPSRLLVLTGPVLGINTAPPAPRAALIWSNASYQIWETGNEPWFVPLQLVNPNGIEQEAGRPMFWVGQIPAGLDVMSACHGQLTLQASLRRGPGRPDMGLRQLEVRTNHGYRTVLTTWAGEQVIRVPIPSGQTTIFLAARNRRIVPSQRGGNNKDRLVGFQDLRLKFTPASGYRSVPGKEMQTVSHVPGPSLMP
jgi:hypothetical protein